jgi:hypothetical protein
MVIVKKAQRRRPATGDVGVVAKKGEEARPKDPHDLDSVDSKKKKPSQCMSSYVFGSRQRAAKNDNIMIHSCHSFVRDRR